MNRDARTLDQLVREWWLEGADEGRFSAILDLALTTEVVSLVPLARALSILDQADLAPALVERVDQLRGALGALIRRSHQVDSLGDLGNEPETLFALLGGELESVEGYSADRLRKARLAGQGSRAASAEALLKELGWGALSSQARSALSLAIADLRERERFNSWGLFVRSERKEGLALGIQFVFRESGEELVDQASPEVHQQARIVARLLAGGAAWEMSIEWPATFAGESIGLPLCIAALTARGTVPRDALLASTGRVDISGNVLGVAGIPEKMEAALRLGMRRVVVAQDNYAEAKAAAGDGLTVVPVGHVTELTAALRQPLSTIDFDLTALSQLIRASLRDYGLALKEEKTYPHGRCFIAGNTSGKVSLWVYSNGRVSAQGGEGAGLESAQRLIRERVPADPEARPTQSFEILTDALQEESRLALEHIGASHEAAHENEVWRLKLRRARSNSTIVLYSTGKCVLQGTAPAWQMAFEVLNRSLAPVGGLSVPIERARADQEAATLDSSVPHIGTDEAGKGDYFGPLVCAAVYVDEKVGKELQELGVRDSKALSDRRVKELAEAIRRVGEGWYAVTAINPPKFNDLYNQFSKEKKNLNSLLAWGHARSIDRLLKAPSSRAINPRYVLVDQFADEHHVEERTRRAGIPVYQRTKAEADIAVAAASILARDAFLRWIEAWSAKVGIDLPKGASPQVIDAAKEFVKRWGRAALADVAKLSFRTTKQVLEGQKEDVPYGTPPWAADREAAHDS